MPFSKFNPGPLKNAVEMACHWLIAIAQKKESNLTFEKNSQHLNHQDWRGSIRGEYSAATSTWDYFCPVWHTGQAIKALVLAHQLTGTTEYLHAAELSAGFLARQQIQNKTHPDFGLLYAYEDDGRKVNTSAVLEALEGLLMLGDITGNKTYTLSAVSAAEWVVNHAWIPGSGKYHDLYCPVHRRFEKPGWCEYDFEHTPGRPLLDDAALLKCFLAGGSPRLKQAFFETANCLLAYESPAGNWIQFVPCSETQGVLHPRHAYWWGRPMIEATRCSGEEKYLGCAVRAGEWYIRAQRQDGGLFRDTHLDFSTPSFGHCTSGAACAGILWLELWQETGDARWLAPLEKALRYCMDLQFIHPRDPNLEGAVLEKVLPPRNSDCSPYYLRDLSTIFFIQCACLTLLALQGAHSNTLSSPAIFDTPSLERSLQ